MKAIMYHYVRPKDSLFPFFKHLDLETFKNQLAFFKKEFGFITKEDFKTALRTGIPAKGVILTFDDGFKDHYQYVFPELLKYGLWGFFYVATSPFFTGKLIDVHRAHLLLGKYGGEIIASALQEIVTDEMLPDDHIYEFRHNTYPNQDNTECTNYVKRVLNYYIDYKYRQSVIDKLMINFFPEESKMVRGFYLNQKELLEMHKAGMIFGSHTSNHRLLSKLSIEEQAIEIESSLKFIESITGSTEIKTFCYPYGLSHSFTSHTERILEEQGYVCSFNIESRDINHDDLVNRKQALPRYDCNEF